MLAMTVPSTYTHAAAAVAGALGAVVNSVGVGLSHARDLGSRTLPSIASLFRPSDGQLQLAQQRSPVGGGGASGGAVVGWWTRAECPCGGEAAVVLSCS